MKENWNKLSEERRKGLSRKNLWDEENLVITHC
jgi:hypothetical protein